MLKKHVLAFNGEYEALLTTTTHVRFMFIFQSKYAFLRQTRWQVERYTRPFVEQCQWGFLKSNMERDVLSAARFSFFPLEWGKRTGNQIFPLPHFFFFYHHRVSRAISVRDKVVHVWS